MGIKDNIAAVRADVSNQSQNFFIYYFKKFPENQNQFGNYKGKSPDSLKSVPAFPVHVQKVVTMLMDVIERSGDPAALKADAQKLKTMPQHSNLGLKEFKDLFAALTPYLEDALGGSCDSAAFNNAGSAIVAALQTAGFK